MDLMVLTGNRCGRWTGNRKFIWSGLSDLKDLGQTKSAKILGSTVYGIKSKCTGSRREAMHSTRAPSKNTSFLSIA